MGNSLRLIDKQNKDIEKRLHELELCVFSTYQSIIVLKKTMSETKLKIDSLIALKDIENIKAVIHNEKEGQ